MAMNASQIAVTAHIDLQDVDGAASKRREMKFFDKGLHEIDLTVSRLRG